MPARRRRTSRRRNSVSANALKGRPNLTRVRQSISTQTITTGSPKIWDILSGGAGNPPNWWANHDSEIVVARVHGFVAFAPNIVEETIGSAFFESYAAYWGIMRNDTTTFNHGGVTTLVDPFNQPDREWMRQGKHKGLVQSSIDSVVFSSGDKGVGSGRYWPIDTTLNVKLAHRETLWLATNYTDDGSIDNSSWWFNLTLDCRY